MLYGVQHYPEHWPNARWAIDAQLMQEVGINVVRMGVGTIFRLTFD